MTLNLHGEVPNSVEQNINELNAEEKFLPTLLGLNKQFPKSVSCSYLFCKQGVTLFFSCSLRIILEHCSTKAAVEAVSACTSSVAGE